MSYSFGPKIVADVAGPIEAWRDGFVSTVGIAKYRRAAGWTVDEVAVVGIHQQFHKTLRWNDDNAHVGDQWMFGSGSV